MSSAENKSSVQRCVDTFNTDDPSAFEDLCSPEIALMLRDVMKTLAVHQTPYGSDPDGG